MVFQFDTLVRHLLPRRTASVGRLNKLWCLVRPHESRSAASIKDGASGTAIGTYGMSCACSSPHPRPSTPATSPIYLRHANLLSVQSYLRRVKHGSNIALYRMQCISAAGWGSQHYKAGSVYNQMLAFRALYRRSTPSYRGHLR